MKTFFRVFSIILLVSWMGLIFYFSHQTATESSIVSGSVIEFLAEKFHPDFISLSELEKQELISVDDLIGCIEDLDGEIEKLQERIQNLQEDIQENYKPISKSEMYDA